jgi:hypothetical protein
MALFDEREMEELERSEEIEVPAYLPEEISLEKDIADFLQQLENDSSLKILQKRAQRIGDGIVIPLNTSHPDFENGEFYDLTDLFRKERADRKYTGTPALLIPYEGKPYITTVFKSILGTNGNKLAQIYEGPQLEDLSRVARLLAGIEVGKLQMRPGTELQDEEGVIFVMKYDKVANDNNQNWYVTKGALTDDDRMGTLWRHGEQVELSIDVLKKAVKYAINQEIKSPHGHVINRYFGA